VARHGAESNPPSWVFEFYFILFYRFLRSSCDGFGVAGSSFGFVRLLGSGFV
jgi:hypothetical protein